MTKSCNTAFMQLKLNQSKAHKIYKNEKGFMHTMHLMDLLNCIEIKTFCHKQIVAVVNCCRRFK